MTRAERHDSQAMADVLDPTNSSGDVWADSAYRAKDIEAIQDAADDRSRVHRRAPRGHPLSAREKAGNTTRSRVRARVEHVIGHMTTAIGAKVVRMIGLGRAKVKIGLTILAYNMSRYATLHRMEAAPP